MPGTRAGALKAARTLKAKDPKFYAKIGAKSRRKPQETTETTTTKAGERRLPQDGKDIPHINRASAG